MKILNGLNEQGNTIVLITHDDAIAANAKRVVRIMDGRIESDLTKSDEECNVTDITKEAEDSLELTEVIGTFFED